MSGNQSSKIGERDSKWQEYYHANNLDAEKRQFILNALVNFDKTQDATNNLDMGLKMLEFEGESDQGLVQRLEKAIKNKYKAPSLRSKTVKQDINKYKAAFLLHEYQQWFTYFIADKNLTLLDLVKELSMIANALRSNPNFKDVKIEDILGNNQNHPLVAIYKELYTKIKAEVENILSEMLQNSNLTGQDIAQIIVKLYQEIIAFKEIGSNDFSLNYSIFGNDSSKTQDFYTTQLSSILKDLLNSATYQNTVDTNYTVPSEEFIVPDLKTAQRFDLAKLIFDNQLKEHIVAYYTTAACMTDTEREVYRKIYVFNAKGITGLDKLAGHLKNINSFIESVVAHKMKKFDETLKRDLPNFTPRFMLDTALDILDSFADNIMQLQDKQADNRAIVIDCAMCTQQLAKFQKLLTEKINALSPQDKEEFMDQLKTDRELTKRIDDLKSSSALIIREHLASFAKVVNLPLETNTTLRSKSTLG